VGVVIEIPGPADRAGILFDRNPPSVMDFAVFETDRRLLMSEIATKGIPSGSSPSARTYVHQSMAHPQE
jgi:hypothetical protein